MSEEPVKTSAVTRGVFFGLLLFALVCGLAFWGYYLVQDYNEQVRQHIR